MRQLIEILADTIDVQPAFIKKLESHGMCFFIWPDSNLAGGQCQHCHNIVWVNVRRDPILSERKPSNVPSFGSGYNAYYHENIQRFLKSLPACPKCGFRCYDKFINNVSFPRLQDGTELDESEENYELIDTPPNSVKVWFYD